MNGIISKIISIFQDNEGIELSDLLRKDEVAKALDNLNEQNDGTMDMILSIFTKSNEEIHLTHGGVYNDTYALGVLVRACFIILTKGSND